MIRLHAARAVAVLLLLPAAVRADRRYYAETYSAVTAPPGGFDIEPWTTLHQPARASSDRQVWRHQLELETGLTDRWDIALYNVWVYEQGDRTRYEAVKAESRYRLSQPGQWFVDPVLYLEVKKEFLADKPWAVEEKLILGKDLRAWNVSLNLVAEQEFPEGGGTEQEWGWAIGTSYELHPALRLGGEAFGAFAKGAAAGDKWVTQVWSGPAVSIAWSRFWLVLGVGFGLNDQSEKLRARAIFSVQL